MDAVAKVPTINWIVGFVVSLVVLYFTIYVLSVAWKRGSEREEPLIKGIKPL